MIKEVELEGDVKILKSEKNEYRAKNVIIATGAHARPIGCKGEGQFRGKGVSYCATCDANFFEDFEVYVVGGGDSAVEEAMYLTKFAKKGYDQFTGEMNSELQNQSRRKHLRIQSYSLCGIR